MHLLLYRGFFWIFPPDPVIKPSWFEIEDSFISPWQLSLLLPTILPNLFKQHPVIKATWQAFKALDKLTMHKISHLGQNPAIKINGLHAEGHGSEWLFFICEEGSSLLTVKLSRAWSSPSWTQEQNSYWLHCCLTRSLIGKSSNPWISWKSIYSSKVHLNTLKCFLSYATIRGLITNCAARVNVMSKWSRTL